LRRLIVATLRREPYEVIEAPDGIALLTAVERPPLTAGPARPRSVSDVAMPMLSAWTRSRPRGHAGRRPGDLITAFGDRELHDEATQLGAFAILDKPFD